MRATPCAFEASGSYCRGLLGRTGGVGILPHNRAQRGIRERTVIFEDSLICEVNPVMHCDNCKVEEPATERQTVFPSNR